MERFKSIGAETRMIQVKNPISKHYVKIDLEQGRIVGHKKTKGPYKNTPIDWSHDLSDWIVAADMNGDKE